MSASCQWRIIDKCSETSKDTIYQQSKSDCIASFLEIYQQEVNAGYLNCQLDTMTIDSCISFCLSKGQRYSVRTITLIHPDNRLERLHFNQRKNLPFHSGSIVNKSKSALHFYREHGYPFVALQLDSIQWQDSLTNIYWRIDKGPSINMDSLFIRSEQRMPYSYLRKALGYEKGKPYKESFIQVADQQIRRIRFLDIAQSSEVKFNSSGAQLIIYPFRKPANSFQGIMGIRPDEITGKINLTGDVELRLFNSLNTGEELYLNWRKMQTQTQDLEARAQFSYLMGTSFGPDGSVKIYRRDSTFTSVQLIGGLSWKPNFNSAVRAFAERLISSTIKPNFQFTENANVDALYFGLEHIFNLLDNIDNPRKGIFTRGKIARGRRKRTLENINETATISQSFDAIKGEIDCKFFVPTFKHQCVMIGINANTLQTDSILKNEMTRIGGLRTFRGIDEESILATSYSILSLEYRYLLDTQTAVYIFSDLGWWEEKGKFDLVQDTPYSFGAGINLRTPSGIFTFNYALGKQFDNPILLKNAKISLGFRSVF